LTPPAGFPDPPPHPSSIPVEPSFSQKVFEFARWVLFGEGGLRGGWSISVLLVLFVLFGGILGFLAGMLHLSNRSGHMTARSTFVGELIAVISLFGAASIVALIERRRVFGFNLAGPRPIAHFSSGIIAGFLALSSLVAGLALGGWLHFGPQSLTGIAIAKYAVLWGITFLLVGCFEEGMFRCYLQFTLSRSLNFWWALGILLCACISLALRTKGSAAWGVYAVALIGVVPCLLLQIRQSPNSGFWQAAWVTSTLFGLIHVSNNGENWIGIFAAAAIGFVFCVSVWVTGSAWWAIGCHAGWDWGETYFYGTADSGMVAPGHYLSTSPSGNAFWSGGTDGPEGSILVLGTILLLLVALLVLYGRKTDRANTSSAAV
jgi:membrane protease YdiL (CAAX protease family)